MADTVPDLLARIQSKNHEIGRVQGRIDEEIRTIRDAHIRRQAAQGEKQQLNQQLRALYVRLKPLLPDASP